MYTTIRLKKKTKKRIDGLDIAKKNSSYDQIINILVNKFKKSKKR